MDASRLLSPGNARYIPPHRSCTGSDQFGEIRMAALIALGLAFGIFAILNLIDNKRLD